MNSFLGLLVGQLPRAITPTIAGLSVGAFVGVVGFLAVMLLVGRGQRRAAARHRRPVVHVPPYAAFFPNGSHTARQRVTPLPPNAFSTMPAPQIHVAPLRGPLPFTPSTALSARALAKVYGGEESAAYMALPADEAEAYLPQVIVPVGLVNPEPPPPSEPAPESIPIFVSPIVMVDRQEPHPLGIIPSDSSAMEAAPPATLAIAPLPKRTSSKPPPPPAPPPPSTIMRSAKFDDFDVDEGATEIAETIFDEPPRRPGRSEPPRIRPVAPTGPRFPAAPRVPSTSSVALPAPTPPPTRVAARHHS